MASEDEGIRIGEFDSQMQASNQTITLTMDPKMLGKAPATNDRTREQAAMSQKTATGKRTATDDADDIVLVDPDDEQEQRSHQLSASDSEDEFLGYLPVKKRKKAKDNGTKSKVPQAQAASSTATSAAACPVQPQASASFQPSTPMASPTVNAVNANPAMNTFPMNANPAMNFPMNAFSAMTANPTAVNANPAAVNANPAAVNANPAAVNANPATMNANMNPAMFQGLQGFQMPGMPFPVMFPNFWPYMAGPQPQATQEEPAGEDGELADSDNEVSLDEHIKAAEVSENVGPPLSNKVASFANTIWSKPIKGDIKELYENHLRPENVPCLKRIDMDQELMDALPSTSKAKLQDFTLRGLNNAFVHAAIVSCKIMDIAKSASKSDDIRQQIVNVAVDSMKILAYGAQATNTFRKEQLRPVLNPLIKGKLCSKKMPIEEMNTSHCLFGGDVQTVVKKGTYSDAL